MKQCIRCKQKKLISEFNFKFLSKGIRQAQCKSCTRSYVRDHYNKNKEYYLLKAKRRNEQIRITVRRYLWEFLSNHKCIDCGEKDPIVLEFDHIRDKLFAVSSIGRNRSMLQIKREIEKCEVRCANCHRRKTAKQFSWHKKFMPL